ncbi:MAG TPA: hypothetical protein VK587_03135 [bacterium]|nr:hypothetical protein [bacterium]
MVTFVGGSDKFVGIQISPVSFIDEQVGPLLDRLRDEFGINVLLIGTLSWLGLKVGRRISWKLDGWPDHGAQDPTPLRGGSYIAERPEYYQRTIFKQFRAEDEALRGVDILAAVIPEARRRGMQVYPEIMEPLFHYEGHGAAETVALPDLPRVLEIDVMDRVGRAPCLNHPDYRAWWHAIVEDYCRSYDIDGIMWCNERRSPLDTLIGGGAPQCFCEHCRALAHRRGLDVERIQHAYRDAYDYVQRARAGEELPDGALVEFLRVLYDHPELLLWERFWVERDKDLDRELYGIVKRCNPSLRFGLNVWNRNHLNPLRKAEWPWAEMTGWCDWVKPIAYQHQAGGIYAAEMAEWHRSILRDVTPQEMTPLMYRFLQLDEAPWDEVVQRGFDPDTYVYGQCLATVRAVAGRVPVYMGIGVDAPRTREDQAKCTPEIVRRSVLATYRAGGSGVVFSPNYAGMNLSTLRGAADALRELGLLSAAPSRDG